MKSQIIEDLKKDIFIFEEEDGFVIKGLEKGSVGILGGLGSGGKSYLALETAIKYILGKEFFLFDNETIKKENRKKILFFTTEDQKKTIKKRIRNILKNIFKVQIIPNMELTTEHLELMEALELLSQRLIISDETNVDLILSDLEIIEKDEYDLIILDTFSTILNIENENDNAEVARKIRIINRIAKEKQSAILIIHHLSQSGMNIDKIEDIEMSKIRGATALVNNVRFVSIIANIKKEFFFKIVKSNLGFNNWTLELDPDFWNNGFKKNIQIEIKGR